MTEISKSSNTSLLERLGFTKSLKKSTIVWTRESDNSENRMTITEKQGVFKIIDVCATWNVADVIKRIAQELKHKWGKSVKIWHKVSNDGSLHIVCEVRNTKCNTPNEAELRGSACTIGWTTQVTVSQNSVALYTSNHFLIGDAPNNWFLDANSSTKKGFFGKASKQAADLSVFECEMPFELIALSFNKPRTSESDLAEFRGLISTSQHRPIDLIYIKPDQAWNLCSRDKIANITLVEPPMSVLESRALRSTTQNFDRLFINQGDYSAEHTPSLPQNRIALMILHNPTSRKLVGSHETNLSKHTEDMTISSALLSIYLESKNWSKALNILQHIANSISKNIASLDEIAPLGVVLAEVAGDILAHLEPEKALLAYSKANSNSVHPRFLEKIARVSLVSENPEREIKVLKQWANVERRLPKLQYILERMATLCLKLGREEQALNAVEALSSIRLDPTRFWISICKDAAVAGFTKKSLAVLNLIDKKIQQVTSPSDRDALSIEHSKTVSQIWAHHLNRPDLAIEHFNLIIEKPEHSSAAEIKAAEHELELNGDVGSAVASRKARWQKMDPDTRKHNLDIGLSLFENAMLSEQYQAQVDLCESLIRAGKLPDSFLKHLNQWKDKDANLKNLISACIDSKKFIEDTDALIFLAEISLKDYNQPDNYYDLLSEKSAMERISNEQFFKVLNFLSQKNGADEIANAIVNRYQSTSLSTQEHALTMAIQLEIFDDDCTIDQIIFDFSQKNSHIPILVSRISSAFKNTQIKTLDKLTASLSSDTSSGDFVYSVLSQSISIASSKNELEVREPLTRMIELLADVGPRSVEHLTSTTKDLYRLQQFDLAKRWLIELIKQGDVSGIELSCAEDILSSTEAELAHYYSLVAATSSITQAPGFARKAITSFKNSGSLSKSANQCYAVLVSSGQISMDDLHDLRTISDSEDGIKLLVSALISLSRRVEYASKKESLLVEAAEVSLHRLMDNQLHYEITMEAYQDSTNPTELVKVAKAAQNSGNKGHAGELCLGILRTPDCLTLEEDIIFECLMILGSSKETRKITSSLIETLIGWAESAQNKRLASILLQNAVKSGLASKPIIVRQILNLLHEEGIDSAAGVVAKLLIKSDFQKEPVAQVLDELASEVSNSESGSLWWQILAKIASNEYIDSFSKATRSEVVLRYANWLYTLENHRDEALNLYLYVFSENKLDTRTWIPLFILLEDQEDDLRLLHLLEAIIPKIEKNPSLLDAYPVTIESMRNSLSKARARLSKKLSPSDLSSKLGASTRQDFMAETLDDHQSALAQPQSMNSIPQISIEPNEVAGLISGSTALQIGISENSFEGIEPTIAAALEGTSSNAQDPESMPSSIVIESASTPSTIAHDLDWRVMALIQEAPADATARLMNTAFANETEKHIAIQVAAILCGDFQRLENWHWRTWKNSHEFGYPLTSTARLYKSEDLPHLKSPIMKYLRLLSPFVSKSLRSKLSIIKQIEKISPSTKIQMDRIPSDHAVIARTGLRYVVPRIMADGFLFIDTPAIGTNVFVDPWTRKIHINARACADMPIGYLLHKVRYQIYSISTNMDAVLRKEGIDEILLITSYLKNLSDSSPLDRIKAGFTQDSGPLKKLLENANKSKLFSALEQCKPITAKSIQQIHHEFSLLNFRVQLSGTLDLIGIFEAILGVPLATLDQKSIQEAIRKSIILRDLMMYTSKIRF